MLWMDKSDDLQGISHCILVDFRSSHRQLPGIQDNFELGYQKERVLYNTGLL